MKGEVLLGCELRQAVMPDERRDGLFLRVIAGRAIRYELTELARGLVPILAALERWSAENDVRVRALASIGAKASAPGAPPGSMSVGPSGGRASERNLGSMMHQPSLR